ncbi:transcription factor [Achlya hypogyna]|uniref:Transcription factor n=1 Tax=Achlya hypogyna TaxID=1202772 RepID=A0A1V9ZRD1_ACHHY|nr:transcription factor [Achlya hypogyna]
MSASDDDAPCRVCGKSDQEEYLVLCDGCDAPFHTFCHSGCVCCKERPRNNFKKVYDVPEGDWFCKFCTGHAPAAPARPLSSIFAWGDNEDGQLGLNDRDLLVQPTPTKVTGLGGISVRDIGCGETFTVVLSNEGDAYSVGVGASGQLGHNDVVHEKLVQFRKIETLEEEKRPAIEGRLDQVQCGRDFAIIVTQAGHVYSWGNGELGQLGHQENKNKKIPKKVSALREKEIPAVLARCGGDFVVMTSGVAKEDDYFHRELPGVFMSMGGNANGQLADGSGKNQWVPQYLNPKGPATTEQAPWTPEPPQSFLLGRDISLLALGSAHGAVALKSAPGLWTWGFGEFGQLGHAKPAPAAGQSRFFRQQFRVPRPYAVEALQTTRIKLVACGGNHTLLVTDDDRILGMGNNEFGQLGTEAIDDNADNEKLRVLALPTAVPGLDGHAWTGLVCGENHSMALTAKGEVFTWGKNDRGQLGLGHTSEKVVAPTQVPKLPKIIKLFGGWNHTFALESAAKVPEKKPAAPAAKGKAKTKAKGGAKAPAAKRARK